jgi:hypothetical protein
VYSHVEQSYSIFNHSFSSSGRCDFILSEKSSVVEPHHFYAAPGKNFDVAPAPTLPVLYIKAKFLKRPKV